MRIFYTMAYQEEGGRTRWRAPLTVDTTDLFSDAVADAVCKGLERAVKSGGNEHGIELQRTGTTQVVVANSALADRIGNVNLMGVRVLTVKAEQTLGVKGVDRVTFKSLDGALRGNSAGDTPYDQPAEWAALYAGRLFGPEFIQGQARYTDTFAVLALTLMRAGHLLPETGTLQLFKGGVLHFQEPITDLRREQRDAAPAGIKVSVVA